MVINQLMRKMQVIHQRNFMHRDIKPDNFLMGLGAKSNMVHVIDLGLMKSFKDPVTNKHIKFITNKQMTGTARYCSINSHLGYELSRRDDLEALCYLMIYLYIGKLPWQSYNNRSNKNKYKKIGECKEAFRNDLCRKCPK